ncbi:MAG: hypothetical protein AAF563_23290 [Pseudomonadota bacterium]
MRVPTFDAMVDEIRQATAEQRLVSRTPLATLVHFELLRALNDLEVNGNRASIREAYACLYEYDALSERQNGTKTVAVANGHGNGRVVSLSSIRVCADDRVTARSVGG